MTKRFINSQIDLFGDADILAHYNRKSGAENTSVQKTSNSGDISLSDFYDGKLRYIPNWLDHNQADEALKILLASPDWRQDKIRLYGKWITIPRMQAWYGDPEACYQYSGLEMTPKPWTPLLTRLKFACEIACGAAFNSVLANLYRHGADSMGMHSDDEPELGAKPVIASVTLGQSRRFDLKHKKHKTRLSLNLEHGSLLVMQGDTQQHWQHGIQKTKKTVSERINLTFRNIKVGKS